MAIEKKAKVAPKHPDPQYFEKNFFVSSRFLVKSGNKEPDPLWIRV
jgi:hypothetical protein